MDEQTTAAQQNSYDVSADGLANAGYEEEPITPAPEEPSQPESEKELAPDGVRLNEDGNIEFGSEFFGDMPDSAEEEPKAPQYYTDDELSQIPFQQWDLSRLNGNIPVSHYVPIVQSQLQRAQAYRQSQTWENRPLPSGITEPKAYTPKELSEEALKLACEKLGIEDVGDFDSYEGEHSAAYDLAKNELIQKRNAEMSGYQNALQSWQANNRYQAELTQRADFREFQQWYLRECQRAGYTPEQVEAALNEAVKQNGNNFGLVQQTVEGWYQTFLAQKGTPKPRGKYPRYDAQTSRYPRYEAGGGAMNAPRMRRVSTPPVLESTRGNNYAGRTSIRAEDFAGMTADEQAQALMNMGVV